jgi:hypothetical protein
MIDNGSRNTSATHGSVPLQENSVMKRSLFWTVMATVVFAIMSIAVPFFHSARAGAHAVPMSGADPHMAMTKLRPLEPGDKARAQAIVAAAKKIAERYRDYHKAEADGFVIFMPEQRQNVYHFIRESDDKAGFDPNDPHALLYAKTDGKNREYELVGVMYTAPYDSTEEELNARIPLSIARWHVHLNLCIPQQQNQRNWLMGDPEFGLNGSISTAEACRAVDGRFLPHLAGWMTHVYPFETDPSKIWGAGMDDHHGMKKQSRPGMKM